MEGTSTLERISLVRWVGHLAWNSSREASFTSTWCILENTSLRIYSIYELIRIILRIYYVRLSNSRRWNDLPSSKAIFSIHSTTHDGIHVSRANLRDIVSRHCRSTGSSSLSLPEVIPSLREGERWTRRFPAISYTARCDKSKQQSRQLRVFFWGEKSGAGSGAFSERRATSGRLIYASRTGERLGSSWEVPEHKSDL